MKAIHIVVDQESESEHERTRGFKGWSLVSLGPDLQKFPQPPKMCHKLEPSVQNMSPRRSNQVQTAIVFGETHCFLSSVQNVLIGT